MKRAAMEFIIERLFATIPGWPSRWRNGLDLVPL